METVLSGIQFGESPRWHQGRLWLSDWGAHELIALDPSGERQLLARVASFPFCFDWLPDGRLLVVHSARRVLLRREADGAFVTHAELGRLSAGAWNEIVVDGRGNAYVNGSGFDLMTGEPYAPGTIVVVSPDGAARAVADGLAFPNGMVVTPDNATLIVAESYASRLTAFDIGRDGGLSNRRVWAELPGDHPDGICLDVEGALWSADVANKHCVRVGEGGTVLQRVDLDRGCFACTLGGADRTTLYLIAREWDSSDLSKGMGTGQVLRLQAPAAGAGWPGA